MLESCEAARALARAAVSGLSASGCVAQMARAGACGLARITHSLPGMNTTTLHQLTANLLLTEARPWPPPFHARAPLFDNCGSVDQLLWMDVAAGDVSRRVQDSAPKVYQG